MSLKRETPCDWMDCPYGAQCIADCVYYCSADETKGSPETGIDEKRVEVNIIFPILSETIKKLSENDSKIKHLRIDEIIKDLEHIKTCLIKGVYDKED